MKFNLKVLVNGNVKHFYINAVDAQDALKYTRECYGNVPVKVEVIPCK